MRKSGTQRQTKHIAKTQNQKNLKNLKKKLVQFFSSKFSPPNANRISLPTNLFFLRKWATKSRMSSIALTREQKVYVVPQLSRGRWCRRSARPTVGSSWNGLSLHPHPAVRVWFSSRPSVANLPFLLASEKARAWMSERGAVPRTWPTEHVASRHIITRNVWWFFICFVLFFFLAQNPKNNWINFKKTGSS